ncbi:MAG: dockerin type I domain-containing protein, partial [Planctomycetota bacterium]
IVLDIPGLENVGLYFEEGQQPDFIPIPEGSELSNFVREELVGLDNMQLQSQFGISFSDTIVPGETFTSPIVPGAVIGPAASAYCSFPPPMDDYWSEFIGVPVLGDLNGDRRVNLLDIDPFVDLLSNGGYSANADFNNDGRVNLLDIASFVEALSCG